MQKIKLPEQGMTWEKAKKILDILEGGDVLLSYEEWHITNLFIPGEWDHAAIFNNKDELSQDLKDKFIVEAVGGGVRQVELLEWIFGKKDIMILRRKGKNFHQRLEFGRWSEKQVGYPYDYEFSTGNTNCYYCSELAADATDVPINDIIVPSDMPKMKDYYEVLFSTKDCK